MRAKLPSLFLVTDERRQPDPEPAIRGLPPGAGVIFRHYGDPRRKARAARAKALCRARRLVFLVAGDHRLAAALRADGLHLPEGLGSALKGWRRRRPDWLITVAAHSAPALLRATGADGVLLSPVFATASHPAAKVLGPLRFARLARASRAPVIALGGMTGVGARRLAGSRLAGIAAISGLAAAAGKLRPSNSGTSA